MVFTWNCLSLVFWQRPHRTAGSTSVLRVFTANGLWPAWRLRARLKKQSDLRVLAGLLPLQKLRMETDSSDLHSVQAYTMQGALLGRLETAAAEFLHEQTRQINVVLGLCLRSSMAELRLHQSC